MNEKHCKYWVKRDFLYPSKITAQTQGSYPFSIMVTRRSKKQAIEDIEEYIKKLGYIPERMGKN